jgi:anti-sigma B factor antagonist
VKGTELELEVLNTEAASILKIKGDVDLYSSPQVRKEVITLITKMNKNLLVDLAEVTYMDSSGVATLVEALQLTKKRGGKLKLFSLGSTVRDVFELSRLDKVFDICDNQQQALEGI